MKYLIGKNDHPLIHVSSGQLLDGKNFTHPRRNLDTFVIIICLKGTLYMAQDERCYTLRKNNYIVLFTGHEHYGYQESDKHLTYCWCHFRIKDDDFSVLQDNELSYFFRPNASGSCPNMAVDDRDFSKYYILPEYGEISPDGKAILIFHQILDLARENGYSSMLPNYALSLLAMELSQEFMKTRLQDGNRERNPKMEKIIEWIRVNYNVRMNLKEIARMFSYNPDYLSMAFRRYTGYPLMKYISLVRIANAKKMLLNTGNEIKEIAYKVGFDDEKVFMKRFKQYEQVTPTAYRNAFSRVKIVR